MKQSKIVAYGLIDNDTGELLHGRIYLKLGTAKGAWAKIRGGDRVSVQPLSAVEPPVPSSELKAMLEKRHKAAMTRWANERVREEKRKLDEANRKLAEAQALVDKLTKAKTK